ncbi:MAG: phosphoribosylaminoimidazolecarboxamide formyltransferase [Clostridia bacterium]|nr:phosphoribosylaminoimidazolecarboxamide formyltransferase [Clostridia bacterium]
MRELELKYGCNPNQKPARVFLESGEDLPFEILSGRPGYINLLDAFNSWQLVKELSAALNMPAATSFKHVSPTSAAVGIPLPEKLLKATFTDDVEDVNESPLAAAYARARGTDRMSSFGDFIALSDMCDVTTAKLIAREVSDGIIAPDYHPQALEILKQKRKGSYNIIKMNQNYIPAPTETKQVYGVTFEQGRNNCKIDSSVLVDIVTESKDLPQNAKRDLLVSLITLKYTQSNSVCFAKDGQAIGVGAGQQSRIHCTRLAANKADIWHLRQHEKVLALPFLREAGRPERDNAIDIYISEDNKEIFSDGNWQRLFERCPDPFSTEEKAAYLAGIKGVSLGSDAFFPFGDNIKRASKSGVSYIAQPGGSIRDDNVIAECNARGITMCFTGIRLFHH